MSLKNKSIEEVLQQFEPMVKKQILSLQIYKNQEEFYQLGLIGLWEAYLRFDEDKGAFPAFAQMTVRGKMLTHLRKEGRFEEIHTSFTDEMAEVLAAPDDSMGVALEKEVVLSYCEGLTEKQLTWVIQGIIENRKPSEIAASEGVPVDRVKGWRKEALKKIRGNVGAGAGTVLLFQ